MFREGKLGYVRCLPAPFVNANTDALKVEVAETGFMNDCGKRISTYSGVSFSIVHQR